MTVAPFAPSDAILIALLLAALYTDLTSMRIPNLLTFGVMGLGLVVSGFSVAWWWGLVGMVLAFGLMFPGYAFFGAVRAGDGKLLMAVGSLLGWQDTLEACLLTYVLNLPFGLLTLAFKGRLGNIKTVMRALLSRARGQKVEMPEGTKVPFAPVIVVAVLIARLVELFQW